MSQKEAIVCPYVVCGRSFDEPIELSVIQADGSPETYRACPHCFSRVSLRDRREKPKKSPLNGLKKRLSETLPSALKKGLKESAIGIEKTRPAGCSHFFGYLKTHPKDSQIPDECLICAEIIKCVLV